MNSMKKSEQKSELASESWTKALDMNETLKVIEDARQGKGLSKAYKSVDDLLEALNDE